MKKDRLLMLLSQLILFGVACFFFTGCMTYDKALRKFGHLAKDSTHIVVRDTIIIPGDSIVKGYRTDTTVIHDVFQQGRAKLTFDRTPKTTTIKAECKPDTIRVEIPANCPPVASFGVSPKYKTWLYIVLGLFVLFILATGFFLLKYIYKLSMIKR